MKKIMIIAAVILCSSVSMFASANLPLEEEAVKQVVTQYMDGVDNKDISSLESVILENGTFTDVNNIAKVVSSYDAAELYSKIRNRRLGGWKRNYEIKSIDAESDIAFVKVEVDVKNMLQYQYVSLVKVEGKWFVASCLTSVVKK